MIIFADDFDRASNLSSGQMRKVLLLLRHAQTADKQGAQLDYDRILTMEGASAVRALSQKLRQQNCIPDLILSSGARRTQQTVELLNDALRLSPSQIQFKRELYEALMGVWLDHVHALPNDRNQVLLVGHNPWLSMLASNFAGSIIDLRPCEIIGFEFKSESWQELSGAGKRVLNIKP